MAREDKGLVNRGRLTTSHREVLAGAGVLPTPPASPYRKEREVSKAEFYQRLGRPVAYHPSIARALGSVSAAIFLDQLLYWTGKNADPRGIYKDAKECEVETGLSYAKQAAARKLLVGLGILNEKYFRLEHRLFFNVNLDRLSEFLEEKLPGDSAEDEVGEYPQKPNSPIEETANGELKKHEMGNLRNFSSSTSIDYSQRIHTERGAVLSARVKPPYEPPTCKSVVSASKAPSNTHIEMGKGEVTEISPVDIALDAILEAGKAIGLGVMPQPLKQAWLSVLSGVIATASDILEGCTPSVAAKCIALRAKDGDFRSHLSRALWAHPTYFSEDWVKYITLDTIKETKPRLSNHEIEVVRFFNSVRSVLKYSGETDMLHVQGVIDGFISKFGDKYGIQLCVPVDIAEMLRNGR